MQRIAFLFGSLLLSVPAAADPLSADRPGVTNPPAVVASRAMQVEGGLTFARETQGHGPNANTMTVPQGLLRMGLPYGVELRISADGFVLEEAHGGNDQSSGSDLVVGSRARLLDQHGLRPATALEFDLSLPTGSDAITSGGVDPSGVVLIEWQLSERFVLDGNLALESVSLGEHESDRAFQVAPSLSLSTSAGTQGNIFIECYAAFSNEGVADQSAIDGGFSWLPSDSLQLDISAGARLNDAAPDFSVSTGAAWRFLLP